ncbi:MAG: putative prepilin peptidase [Jatrophihabitans sp.]|nr:putative prepilin peptidase [Jatrophihabitans sp.]
MITPWPFVVLMGVLGLAIGSFLNVVIYRVPREESIVFPASHCPKCDAPIKTRHNVPVLSWLVLGGRCACCHVRISARYPLVEAGTGVLFAAIALHFGLTLQLPAYLYFASIAVALAMISFDVRRLPDSIVLPSYVISVLLLMPAGAVQSDLWAGERGLIGMVGLLTLYFALALAYPNGLSFGDVKLAGLLGLYLGWLSWGALLVGVFGSFVIAGIGGAAAIATKRGARNMAVPVGPCLIAAALISVFVTAPVTGWYGSLLTV